MNIEDFSWDLLVSYFLLNWVAGSARTSAIVCASTNGRGPESADSAVKDVERLLEEKRRAELSARIASGDFTVERSGYNILQGSLAI